MLIKTVQDIKEAIVKIQSNEISIDDIVFNDFIEDKIKINTELWGNSHVLNYKVAQYILTVQKDFLRSYNLLYGTTLTINDLNKNKDLIILFTIEDGCIKIIARYSKLICEKVFHDMSPTQKTITISLLSLAAMCGLLYLTLDKLIDAGIIGNGKDKIEKINTEKQSPKIIINNIGDGTVYYNDEHPLTKKDLENLIPKRKIEEKEPFDIDNRYIVLRYDYDKQQVYLSNPQCDSFWASTELLTYEKREILKHISDLAIDTGNAQAADLLITAYIDNGKIKNAKIIGINLPQREGVKPLKEVLKENSKRKRELPSLKQGSLLE